MIALVSFEKNLVITEDEAKFLKLNYTTHERFGKSQSYGKQIEPMAEGNYYVDELFQWEVEGVVKYYKDESMQKEISEYYRYDRLEEKNWVCVGRENNLVDLEHFAINCRFPYTITKCIRTEEPTVQNLSVMLNNIEEKFREIDKSLDIFSSQQLNQKVNVHVGGGLIVTYNDLKLVEDSCTDILQNELNEGWRIIAVCVQPDQRRPDYILGRYNPEKDCCETRAKRK